ncbi:AMP-binding protein [Flavobacterium sp. JP2137]|uniref:AMP-binding protein n=1 Tax=Flavobacterium sp. JP2137 TaxID=3414510 RepID=UPI003D2FFBBF
MRSYEIHPSFRLNGKKMTQDQLSHLAFDLIQDGEPYQQDLGKLFLQWFDHNKTIELTTSGTTGEAKGILIKKKAMLHSARATADFFKLAAGDRALLCLSTRYIGGKMMVIRALSLGLELDVVPPSSTPLLGNTQPYDFVAMVPLQVENSIAELARVKTVIIGGAQVNSALAAQLENLDTAVFETYGMTETVSHIAAKKIGESAFTVLPHVHIYADERGCLVINAPKVSDDILVTNDLVNMVNDHQFQWLGRIDNVINSGGVKLFPEQIEAKLVPHIPSRFFVIGQKDEKWGEKLILVIESEPYQLHPDAFKALSKFETPKEILFTAKIEETVTGKILRKQTLANLVAL